MTKKDFFNNLLTNDQIDQINQMIGIFQGQKNIEFEVSFLAISYAAYMRISSYYVDITPLENITAQESLDVSIQLPDGNTYRISMFDPDDIQSFIENFARQDVQSIQKYLLSIKPGKNYEIIFKDRGSAKRLIDKNLGLIFKVSSEISGSNGQTKLKINGTEKMTYRYKARSSFTLSKFAKLDITDVQQSNNLWNLTTRPSSYEIELEFTSKKINMEIVANHILDVLSVVQNSDIPINHTEAMDVISVYTKLLGVKKSSHLESRNVISIDAQHIVKYIPNKYAITDKADGERYFMIILEYGVYLLSTNMTVTKTKLDVSNKKYYGTILDGELISSNNRKMFLAFDVVYSNGVDYRFDNKYNLPTRLIVLDNIIDECFQTLIQFTEYADKYTDMELAAIREYYVTELKSYWKKFNKALSKTNGLFVSRKKYFVPYGIDSSEVFMYADLLWKMCVYDKLTPYHLDGIIYTPISSPYLITASPDKLDAIPLEYKWKNPMQNSIDFFVKFETDFNGIETIYYDMSAMEGEGRPYKICTLYVGITRAGQEKPVPFKVNNVVQTANIYLTDGEARDVEGSIIHSNTVVEFIFDNSQNDINNAYKWMPLRTRYDKTESVQKYGRKYGNNLSIASRIWKTIVFPVTEDIIASLANPQTYGKEMDRLSKSNETYQGKSSAYYQKKTSNATGMRSFNNWIKSNMILAYCQSKKTVLDIGCGRGGDLIKFIHAAVEEYVGIDIDNNGLYVINDSAYTRYKNLKKTIKNIPPMHFIQADAKGLFDIASQERILPNMTSYNKSLITKYLSNDKKYGVINCQFTLHYYLSDNMSWSNFCANINSLLDDNGYLLITCFDGKLLYDRLKNSQKMSITYTDINGNKEIFSEIVKVYDDSVKPGVGLAIDVYNSVISNPDTYIREYLVFPEFLEQSLKENCGLELVESDSFFNIFNIYKNYFLGETTDKLMLLDASAKRYKEIRQFYLSLDPGNNDIVNKDAAIASFKFAMLNRYYVFKKKTKIDIYQPARIIGINNKINLGKILTPYFDNNSMIIDPAQKTKQINKIYHAIRKKNLQYKPSVYIIRHNIDEEKLENHNFRRNKFRLSKIKNGTDPKILLIYKSPEKYFYPIYYRYQNDIFDDDFGRIYNTRNGTYLLESSKIVKDLDFLVALTNKINK